MTKPTYRQCAAYHEAGHAVIAYEVGWWVSRQGVEIDERQYTGLSRRARDDTPENYLPVTLAGYKSEWRWHRLGSQLRSEDDLDYLIGEIRRGNPDECEGDDAAALKYLLEYKPTATDAQLVLAYRTYEQTAIELLDDARIWHAVEVIAAQLLLYGKLTADQVRAALANLR